MAKPAKQILKAFVSDWIDELDKPVARNGDPDDVALPVCDRPARLFSHLRRLHLLVRADYSPIRTASELAYTLESKDDIPLDRSEFPADYYWSIIKKWDGNWQRLGITRRIKAYARKGIPALWERHAAPYRFNDSPYTARWVHYSNLVDAHRLSFGLEPTPGNITEWETDIRKRQKDASFSFGIVAIMHRLQSGLLPTGAEITEMEAWAPGWRKRHLAICVHVAALLKGDSDKRRAFELLYADGLANEIRARHEMAMGAVRSWVEHCSIFSVYLTVLGCAEHIDYLRSVIPLRGVLFLSEVQARKTRRAKMKSKHRPAAELAALDVIEEPEIQELAREQAVESNALLEQARGLTEEDRDALLFEAAPEMAPKSKRRRKT